MSSGDFEITPYEVSGEVDYGRLIDKFGVSKLTQDLKNRIKDIAGENHFLLSRKVFFAHRDLKWLLDEYEKGNKFFLYTGRAPSGPITIGHLLPWVLCRWIQDKFDVEMWFHFPDEEKFLFKDDLNLEDTQKYLMDNMLDVIALGFDPKKTHFLIDTVHSDIMYKEACKVAKRITFSTVKSSFGFTDSTNIGSAFYTSMQAVPTFLPSKLKGKKMPCLIPLGVDQDIHFRISRDVLPKLGYYKPAVMHSVFLPPLTGKGGKMSASKRKTAIYTTDSPGKVKEKINKYAYSGGQNTLEEHREKGGNIEEDVPYQYLKMFFERNDKKLNEIKNEYESGEMLTGEIKQILIDKINDFLGEHQKKRKKAKDKINDFIYGNKTTEDIKK